MDVVVEQSKWGANLTMVVIETETLDKSTGIETNETRIYIADLTLSAKILCTVSRLHWCVEVSHWHLDYNMKQNNIKRKYMNAALFLDTIQRLCLNLLSKWRSNRKEKCDRKRGYAELLRRCQNDFTFIKELLTLK